MSELERCCVKGRLKVDGKIMKDTGEVAVTKAPSSRCGICPASRTALASRRRAAPHAVRADRRHVSGTGQRPDLSVFLPPIGGITLYIFGDPPRSRTGGARLLPRA